MNAAKPYMAELRLTEGGAVLAWVPAIPEVLVCAEAEQEAIGTLRRAIKLALLTRKALGETIPFKMEFLSYRVVRRV